MASVLSSYMWHRVMQCCPSPTCCCALLVCWLRESSYVFLFLKKKTFVVVFFAISSWKTYRSHNVETAGRNYYPYPATFGKLQTEFDYLINFGFKSIFNDFVSSSILYVTVVRQELKLWDILPGLESMASTLRTKASVCFTPAPLPRPGFNFLPNIIKLMIF